MNVTGQQSQGGVGGAPPPVAVQQTTVIQVGSHKSVAGAVVLALLFGPLGMLYATVVGALVMFFVNLLVVFVTLGLGLIFTIPIGAVWAGIAASNHNKRLGAVATQAVATPHAPAPAVPAGWHDDPEGSGRLRYWDGIGWTEHYADKPGAAASEPVPPQTEPAQVSPGPVAETPANEPAAPAAEISAAPAETVTEVAPQPTELPTAVTATSETAFCGACGNKIGGGDRFCASCGANQEEIV